MMTSKWARIMGWVWSLLVPVYLLNVVLQFDDAKWLSAIWATGGVIAIFVSRKYFKLAKEIDSQ